MIHKGRIIASIHINFCDTQKRLAGLRDLLAEFQALQPRTAVSFSFRMTRSNRNLGNVLEGLGSVRLLDMFSNVICDAGMALLSSAIPSLVTLRCLDLTSNLISHAGMVRLAAALPRLPHLRRLRLGGNGLSDASLRCLAPALAALRRTLAELDLNGNRLSAAGLINLSAAIAPLAALRELDLSCCCAGRRLDDAAVTAVAGAVGGLPRLSQLLLFDNDISDASVAALAAALSCSQRRRRRLRHLGIGGVSPAARAMLERAGREAGFAVTEEATMLARPAAARGFGGEWLDGSDGEEGDDEGGGGHRVDGGADWSGLASRAWLAGPA